jgi:hypothetical protein
MEHQDRAKAFDAIKDLTQQTTIVFAPKRQTPMGRYNRLLKNIKLSDFDTVDKFLRGFAQFFDDFDLYEPVPVEAIIPYNKTIFLPIGKLLDDPEEKGTIIRHLESIKRLMMDVEISGMTQKLPTSLNLELALCESKSNEDIVVDQVLDLITTLITQMKNSNTPPKNTEGGKDGDTTEEIEEPKPSNIMDIASGILKSASFSETFENIQSKISNGEIDGMRLMTKLKDAIPQLISKLMLSLGEGGANEEEIQNNVPNYMSAVQSVMAGITGAMGGPSKRH